MMEQFYYTSCVMGQSLGGSSGFQVRAASPSLTAQRMRDISRFVGYTPVSGESHLSPDTAPVRLALLNVNSYEKIACHTTYVGKDPSTGRYGNFFSHVLLDSSGTLTPSTIIESWGCEYWRRFDGQDISTSLQLTEAPQCANVLNVELLSRALQDLQFREMFQFTLDSVLSAADGHRVFLAAPAREVALCIYGVIRAVPTGVLKDFTFSTYESDPFSCPARVVGTWYGTRATAELPSACYENGCKGFNFTSGRKSDLPATGLFATFVVRALQNGDLATLDQFLFVCRESGVSTFPSLESLYRIEHHPSDLTDSDWNHVTNNPRMARRVLSNEEMSDQLLDWTVANPTNARAAILAMKEELRNHPAAVERFVCQAQARAIAASRTSDFTTTHTLLKEVIHALAPDLVGTYAFDLADAATDPASMPWIVRKLLLCCYFGIGSGLPADPHNLPMPRSLLMVSLNEVNDLIELEIPPQAKIAGLLHALSAPAVSLDAATASALARRLALVIQTVACAVDDGKAEAAATLFRRVASVGAGVDMFDMLIESGGSLPIVLDDCLLPLIESKTIDPFSAVLRHGHKLIDCLAMSQSLRFIVHQLCFAVPLQETYGPQVESFLNEVIRRRVVPEEDLMHINSHRTIHQFAESPSLVPNHLEKLSVALAASGNDSWPSPQS